MPYSAKGVANHFLDLADAEGMSIDPLQMQKLVFFAEGWHLALRGSSLINEQFEAWKRGPVVPALYHGLKHFGWNCIEGRLKDFDFSNSRFLESPRPTDEESLQLLKEVWRTYKRYSGPQLVSLTHEVGSPWDLTWQQADGAPDVRIDKDLITEWFTQQAKAAKLRNSH